MQEMHVLVVIERNDEECVWKKLRAATGPLNRLISIVAKSRLNLRRKKTDLDRSIRATV
jgi:hypothetical protein